MTAALYRALRLKRHGVERVLWQRSASVAPLIRPSRSSSLAVTRRLTSSRASCDESIKKDLLQKDSYRARATSYFFQKDDHRIHLPRYYKYLRLETYRTDELERRYNEIVQDDDALTIDNLQPYLLRRIQDLELENTLPILASEDTACLDARRRAYAAMEADKLLALFPSSSSQISETMEITDDQTIIITDGSHEHEQRKSVSQADFCQTLHNLAIQVDYQRTAPIISSMLLVGLSVGILSPAMPFIVQELELSSSQFGLVVSAFGLAKMMGNVPSAIAVERQGRKPYMTYSLGLISIAVAGIGLSSSFEELYFCRLLTGFGVAALSTGGTMMMTDVSTPLNRATTIAPIMSAFSAGTALGPALGGVLVDTVGLHPTFYLTGACFMGVAALNRVIMQETKPKPIVFPWQEPRGRLEDGQGSIWSATQTALAQWAPLLQNPGIKSVLVMNGMYWVALAGGQMTLLPLILTDANGLAMTAMQVGQVYAAMSLVHIFGNPVFAKIADRVGKAPAILAGCGLVSASMAGVSFCETYTDLSVALGFWAVGSSMLSTAPVAYISDKVTNAERAQALALLRTCGDVGFLVGASSIGMLADYNGLDGAMQCSAGVLATATMWFATRHNITARLSALVNK